MYLGSTPISPHRFLLQGRDMAVFDRNRILALGQRAEMGGPVASFEQWSSWMLPSQTGLVRVSLAAGMVSGWAVFHTDVCISGRIAGG